MKVKFLNHDLLIKVDKVMNDTIKVGGKELFFDPTFDPYRNLRIFGEVLEVPGRLHGVVFYQEPAGYPVPLSIRRGGTYQHRFVTCMDQKIEIQPGDKVYFHYLTLDPSTGNKLEEGIYKCPYDAVFCYVRNGNIVPVNGRVLVEPYFDESYEEIEIEKKDISGRVTGTEKIRVKQTASGIIYDVHEKPVFRHGILRYVGSPIKYDFGLHNDMKVLYTDDSEFKNTIEGKEYYVMNQWDIVADHSFNPVRDYVFLKPKYKYNYKSIFYNPRFLPKANEGSILKVGPMCKEVNVGEYVMYQPESTYSLDLGTIDGIFVREPYIYMIKEDE